MKKKVLFALIAMFSFLSTWAQTIGLGGSYEVTFDQTTVAFNLQRPFVLVGEGLPKVTGITAGVTEVPETSIVPGLSDPSKYKVFKKDATSFVQVANTQNLPSAETGDGLAAFPVDNYFLQFKIVTNDKVQTLYVPFQVYLAGTYDYVWNKTTFDASVADGGLKGYYAECLAEVEKSTADPKTYCGGTKENWESERDNWSWAASNDPTCGGSAKRVDGTGFPWIVPVAPAEGVYRCLFVYDGTPKEPWQASSRPVFSQAILEGTGGVYSRAWGIASVNKDVASGAGMIVVDGTSGEDIVVNQSGNVKAGGLGFDSNKFKMYWMPQNDMGDLSNLTYQEEIVPDAENRHDISNLTVTLPSYTFNGIAQKPTFKGDGAYVLPGSNSPVTDALTVDEDFTIEWADGADYVNAGDEKPFTIVGQGLYKGSKIVKYSIARKKIDGDNFSLAATGPFTYDGTDLKPTIIGTVTLGTETADEPGESPVPTALVPGTTAQPADFTVVLSSGSTTGLTEAVNVGEYTYTITPTGNYIQDPEWNGVITKSFSVTAKDLSNYVVVIPTVTTVEDDPTTTEVNEEVKVPGYIYNTKAQKPVFTGDNADSYVIVSLPEPGQTGMAQPLNAVTDYKVTFVQDGDYTNVGQKEFTITGKGNYTGNIGVQYDIFKKNIADDDVVKSFKDPTFSTEGLKLTQENFDYKYNDVALQLAADANSAGDFTWTLKSGDTEHAGDKVITVTGKGNYEGSFDQDVKMKQFAITITAIQTTKVYGQPDPAPEFSIDTNSPTQIAIGSDEYKYIQSFLVMERDLDVESNQPAVRENVVEGGHKYVIKKKANIDKCDYEIYIQERGANLMITPAPLNVHVANNSKTYGDPDPSFIADKKNGNVVVDAFKIYERKQDGTNGTDVTSFKDFVDATKNLKDVLNIGRVAGEDVKDSPYDFTWDNPNYAVTFVPTTTVGDKEVQEQFTITPKWVDIVVNFKSDGYEYKGADWNPIPTVTIKNTDQTLSYPKDFKVEWSASGSNGNTLRDVTLGNNVNDNWPKSTISPVKDADNHVIGNYNFNVSYNNRWKIVPATLTIASIDDNSKIYNTADPEPLTKVKLSGIKGSDYWRYNETTGALETNINLFKASNHNVATKIVVRQSGEHTGKYDITINPDLWTRNYNIVSTAKGAFHIYLSGETFTITFNSKEEYQYDTETPFDVSKFVVVTPPTNYAGGDYTDLVNYAKENAKKYRKDEETGDYVYDDDFNVGNYTLTIDDCPTAFMGYHVDVIEKSLEITPYPLYIASYNSKEYGSEDPEDYGWDVYEKVKVNGVWKYVKFTRDEFTVPEADYIGGRQGAASWMNPGANYNHYTISRAEGENVGHYTTTIRPWRWHTNQFQGTKEYGIQYDGNYSFQFAEGDFEITKRALKITVTGNSKFYGELDPAKEFGYPDVEEQEGDEEEEEEVDDHIYDFVYGHVLIKVENALTAVEAEYFARMVTYTFRNPGEVVDARGYAVNGVKFNGWDWNNVPEENAAWANYKLKFNKNAQFMINKRTLYVVVHDQSVPYATPVAVDPYDLSIVEGIIKNGEYQVADNDDVDGIDVNYDYLVTIMAKGLATDNKAINDRVDQIFKPLQVKPELTKVGVFHKDAYILELTEAGAKNYELEYVNGKVYIEQLKNLYLDTKNLAQVLTDHIGRTVTVYVAGSPTPEEGFEKSFREFKAYDWNTFVLPFTAMPREIVAPFRYGVIDILNEANENANDFSLAVTTKRVRANQPFLIQTDKNMTYANMKNAFWKDVEIADFDYLNADPTAEDAAGNKFIGSYKKVKSDFTEADYIMYRSDKTNANEFFRFIGADASYDMKQTEAYLHAADALAPARIIIDEEDGTATVIEFVGAEGVATSYGEGWYTVNGVKLEAEPTTSGTYIYNGKKVYIQR